MPFAPEPGYFTGDVYFAYALQMLGLVPTTLLLLLARTQRDLFLTILALQILLLAVPIFHLARILWLHFDYGISGTRRGVDAEKRRD